MNNWNSIWNKRKIEDSIVGNLLEHLIRADGFDEGAGSIGKYNWLQYILYIKERLNIEKTDSIFEIGCGGGAFLYPFYKEGYEVAGIDYSEALIEIGKSMMPQMNLSVCEAINLDISRK